MMKLGTNAWSAQESRLGAGLEFAEQGEDETEILPVSGPSLS